MIRKESPSSNTLIQRGRSARNALSNNPFAQFNSQIFSEQIYMLAHAFGIELDDPVTEQDLVLSEKGSDILCGSVKKNTVFGQRYHWQGMVNSRVVIEIDALRNVGEKMSGPLARAPGRVDREH